VNSAIQVKINLRSTIAPSESTVFLEVWNTAIEEWQIIDFNSTAAENTDFYLEEIIKENVSNYFDDDYEIAFRIYQFNTLI
jgi:hypothetical protein